MDCIPWEIVRDILSNVGAHTVPSIKLVCKDWKNHIDGILCIRTVDLGSNFSSSYINWIKSQNLFISMNVVGPTSNLPIEWNAEYNYPKSLESCNEEYNYPKPLGSRKESTYTYCFHKNLIFAKFGLDYI